MQAPPGWSPSTPGGTHKGNRCCPCCAGLPWLVTQHLQIAVSELSVSTNSSPRLCSSPRPCSNASTNSSPRLDFCDWQLLLATAVAPGNCCCWQLPLLAVAAAGCCCCWQLLLLATAAAAAADDCCCWQFCCRQLLLLLTAVVAGC